MILDEKVIHKKTINRFRTLEEDFRNIHRDKYEYTNTVFVNTRTKINIVCLEHECLFKLQLII